MQVRPLGGGAQPVDRLRHQGFEFGIMIAAAVCGENTLVLALGGSNRLGLFGRIGQRNPAIETRGVSTSARDQRHQCRRQRTASSVREPHLRTSHRSAHRIPALLASVALENLDLLRADSFDPWPAPPLDPSADANTTALELFRLEAGGRGRALLALCDPEREIFGPTPA